MTFHPFSPPRSIREYLGQAGSELGGLMLPPSVLDAHATSIAQGLPEEFCVIGYDQADGTRRLRFEVTQAFIEATTEYRHRNGRLRLVCSECGLVSGDHQKGCALS